MEQFKHNVYESLCEIYQRKHIPVKMEYAGRIAHVIYTLEHENLNIRPRSSIGLPGGLVYLDKNLPVILVPDLHARMDFLMSVMRYKPSGGLSIIQMLDQKQIQVVCVGDGFHSEKRGANRWRMAFTEYTEDYKHHKNIDAEMIESMGLMEMVMILKTSYPDHFHFLKGNHENIKNENIHGNRPFGKFTMEGIMVKHYIIHFYDEAFINLYASFEHRLPLLAIGKNFLVSHAQPRIFYDEGPLINYYFNPDAIYDLTWTPDDAAEPGTVAQMLNYYLKDKKDEPLYYFGGHRPVPGLYKLAPENDYVQFHNPDKFIITLLRPDKIIELEKDIFEIPKAGI